VIGASSGIFGAVRAQAELRKVLGAVGAPVTEGEVAVGRAGERVDENGRLNEPNLEQEVHEVITTLLADAQSAKTSRPAANAVTSRTETHGAFRHRREQPSQPGRTTRLAPARQAEMNLLSPSDWRRSQRGDRRGQDRESPESGDDRSPDRQRFSNRPAPETRNPMP
jgi:hypothetical protein